MEENDQLRVRSENLSWRRVGDEVVVLDLTDTVYLTLNHSGAVLWEALADGATTEQLRELLTSRYSVTPEQAAVDVADFVERCRTEGLLEERRDSPAS